MKIRSLLFSLPLLWMGSCAKPTPRPIPTSHTSPPPAKGQALTPDQMEQVQRTINVGMPTIIRCYTDEAERQNNRKLKGSLVVKILIGTAMAATDVQISESTLNAPSLNECIISVVRNWEFPRLAKPAWFTFPYDFSPGY